MRGTNRGFSRRLTGAIAAQQLQGTKQRRMIAKCQCGAAIAYAM